MRSDNIEFISSRTVYNRFIQLWLKKKTLLKKKLASFIGISVILVIKVEQP